MKKATASLLLISALAMSCVTTEAPSRYMRDGKQYGVTEGLFRHRWWNYHERGVSFSEGAFFPEAIRDLEAAIAQRNDDQWRARTYGMHFVDYFPHRELGIVYYRLGRVEDAVRELETSLAGAESAKAKFFLNKARKEFLEQSGADETPPVLTLNDAPNGLVTNAFSLRISGKADDDTFVATIRVNGRALPFELSAARLSFEAELPIEEGSNTITVVAEDLVGNTAEETFLVTGDRRGPVVTIADMAAEGDSFRVEGFVTDETGLATCILNGAPLAVATPMETPFSARVQGERVRIEASDRAGNLTVAEIPTSGYPRVERRRPLLLASLAAEVPLPTSGKSALNDPAPLHALNLKGLLDTTPPDISIRDLAADQKVFFNRILLEGSVTDESTITSLAVNGEHILLKEGKRVYFSHLLSLEVGGNVIEIEAKDSLGNQGRRTVSILREEQKVRRLGSRMRLAVLPLDHKGEASVIGSAVYESFISALIGLGRFDLVERAKVEDVLRELNLSNTELVDPGTAAKAGRLVAAEALVAGTVIETGKAIEVIARLIDTETSLVLSSNDVFDENKSLGAVLELMERLAFKFNRDFPLVEGLVIEAGNGEIMVDLGTEHRIRKNIRLIVFREGKAVRHPLTGRILGSDTEELGEAQVTAVFEDFSKAEVLRRDQPLKPLDRVITK